MAAGLRSAAGPAHQRTASRPIHLIRSLDASGANGTILGQSGGPIGPPGCGSTRPTPRVPGLSMGQRATPPAIISGNTGQEHHDWRDARGLPISSEHDILDKFVTKIKSALAVADLRAHRPDLSGCQTRGPGWVAEGYPSRNGVMINAVASRSRFWW